MTYPAPYALAQVSINAASAVTGRQVVPASATIALSGVNTLGWVTADWTIYGFPPGWTAPIGWTTNEDGSIGYSGTQSQPNPPSFTLPSLSLWGKWGIALLVNGGVDPTSLKMNLARMADQTMLLDMLSPLGLHDMMPFEFTQSGGTLRTWVGDHQTNLRLISAALAGNFNHPNPPVIWSYNASGGALEGPTYTFPSNLNTTVWMDSSANGGGTIAITLDASPSDGEINAWKDIGNVLQTNDVTVTAGGVPFEYPPGTFTTGTLAFNLAGQNGGLYPFQYSATKGKWYFLD